jgi:hypothetical protein
VIGLSIIQLLAQRPKLTPSPPDVLIQPAMPREWSLSWPAAAGRMIKQHTDALAATSRVSWEIAPKAAQRLTLSLSPPYNSRPLEREASMFL